MISDQTRLILHGPTYYRNDMKQVEIPKEKLKAGSITGKIPVYLADGRTVIYVDPSKYDPVAIQARYAK